MGSGSWCPTTHNPPPTSCLPDRTSPAAHGTDPFMLPVEARGPRSCVTSDAKPGIARHRNGWIFYRGRMANHSRRSYSRADPRPRPSRMDRRVDRPRSRRTSPATGRDARAPAVPYHKRWSQVGTRPSTSGWCCSRGRFRDPSTSGADLALPAPRYAVRHHRQLLETLSSGLANGTPVPTALQLPISRTPC